VAQPQIKQATAKVAAQMQRNFMPI